MNHKLYAWLMTGALLVSGCGSQESTANQTAANSVHTGSGAAPVAQSTTPMPRIVVDAAPVADLSHGAVGVALAVHAGEVYAVGGYDGSASSASVTALLPNLHQVSSLPARSHDAAAGFIGSNLYVFGGGQNDSYDTVVRIHSGGVSNVVGHLDAPLSDASCVPYTWHGQQGLVLVGGYDGSVYRKTAQFVSEQGNRLHWSTLFTMPTGLRYIATAVDGSRVYLVGGRTAAGGLSRQVYAWEPGLPQPRPVAQLPYGLQKAGAFAANGQLFVTGGLQQADVATANILQVDTQKGTVKQAGRLPQALADFGYVQDGTTGYIAGGQTVPQNSRFCSQVYVLHLTH